MASMYKPGVMAGGTDGRSSRLNTQRGPSDEGVKRTDSTRSVLDSGSCEQKLKDNIRVAVRIRPLSEKEQGRGDSAVWATDGSGGVGLMSARSDKLNIKYAYDLVFDTTTVNEQVFEHVGRPTIEPVVQGISGTVFAYGVTSSGKTHTMMGTQADPGVVPRAITALFEHIGQATDRVFTVTFSMMEIYCEMLNDLLDASKMNLDVQERELPGGRGATMLVKNLTEGKVSSAEAALALIQQGQDNRKVGATAYNDQSSRSHTLCRFLVESAPANSNSCSSATNTASCCSVNTTSSSASATAGSATTRTSAWLTLVDLAGSEGAKAALSKDQQAEARDINRSLLTLGKVVFELAKGSQGGHVPFRDSLLTRLLKPSLTGNGAKVAIICNVTPASSQSEETWNTLRFADGAKRIKVAAVKNEALDVAAVVAQYQREVEALKAQLAALSGAAAAGGGALSPAVLQAMQLSLVDSSQANTADQLADQEAQLRYLEESNSIVALERDQLLTINRRMMGMLVEQIRGGSSSSSSSSSRLIEGAASLAQLRRCLSFESMQYYSCWQGSQSQQEHAAAAAATAAAAADRTREFLRLSSQDDNHSQADSCSSNAVAQAVQAVQGTAAAPVVPVVPCNVYFPGNRRTSKTLALAVPGVSAVAAGAVTAAWLGPVATASAAAAAAAGCSAVSEAVEAHRKLAEQQARLDVLQQQLEDKELLLNEARQMQEGQALQLRLTITAADRALLRDKLAEAEQQLASYQSILKDYEAEKEELYDTAYSLYGKVQKLTEQNHAAAAQMQQLKGRLAACSSGTASGAATPRSGLITAARPASAAAASTTAAGARTALVTNSAAATAAAAAGGAGSSSSNMVFTRPKSATAALGFRSGFASAAAARGPSASASPSPDVTPRQHRSTMPSRSSSISSSTNMSTVADAAAAGLKSCQSATNLSDRGYLGASNFNPICITSPFSDPDGVAAAAAAGSAASSAGSSAGSSYDGSSPSSAAAAALRTGRGSPSLAGSGGANSALSTAASLQSAASGTATAALLSSAVSAGPSRIPMPPCLQQRPKQRLADNMLMRLGMIHSKLPSAPSSACSSTVASSGGDGAGTGSERQLSNLSPGKPPLAVAPASSSSNNSYSHSSSMDLGGLSASGIPAGSLASLAGSLAGSSGAGYHSRKQSLVLTGSPLVAPVNRLKSQPGLLAVAAAAANEVQLGPGSAAAPVAGNVEVVAEGEAATAREMQELWQTPVMKRFDSSADGSLARS